MATEDEKALIELQDRMLTSTQALARFTQQERAAMRRGQTGELMLSELKGLPDNTRMYRAVGRAYFLAAKTDITQETEETVEGAAKEIEVLKGQRALVETKLKETQAEMKELLNSSQVLMKQLGGLVV